LAEQSLGVEVTMPRALVTGATGFLGGHIVRELLDRDYQVRALYRSENTLASISDLPIETCHGDVNDFSSLAHAMRDSPDVVFHVAASTASWKPQFELQTRINVDGTRNVVQAALHSGVGRLVHTSSVAVYGLTEDLISETSPHLGRESWINYSRSKALGEDAVQEGIRAGLNAVICNPTHVFGPGDTHNWARLIMLVDQGKLPGVPPGRGAFIDVREAAHAHIAAAERGVCGESYLLGGEETSFLDLVQRIGRQLGKPAPSKPIPAIVLKSYAQILDWLSRITRREPELTPESVAFVCQQMRCDISKARRVLNLQVTPLDQLLADTVKWLRQQKLVQLA
jgi:dihydroflavonol-4-reductase